MLLHARPTNNLVCNFLETNLKETVFVKTRKVGWRWMENVVITKTELQEDLEDGSV